MSYDWMDHADWVEGNIAASKRRAPNAKERRLAADGRGWHAAPDRLNPFQHQACTILGIVGGGIYNAPINWGTVRWSSRMVVVTWSGHFASFDVSNLTNLVFLAHDARIRCGIASAGPRSLEIGLYAREASGGIARKHPSLEEAVASHRQRLSLDHPIMYWQRVSACLHDVSEAA